MNTKLFYSVLALSLVTFVFVLTSVIILSEPLPLGSDAYFHLQLSRFIGQGNWTGAINLMFTVNKSPYPPLYHILIAPIAISSDPYTGLRILEMLFLPITFALMSFVVWKHIGSKAALISGLVLISGWAYLDGAIQARPESLDLLIYPIILYAILSQRKKLSGILSALTVYNHGFAAFSNIWGIAIKKLREHTDINAGLDWQTKQIKIEMPKYPWRKTIILTLIAITPVLIISFYYFGGAWQQWATYTPTENPQEALFWTYPPWIPFYAGLSLMGWLFIFKKPQTQLESLLRYGLVGNLIMLPFWADRWLQYSSIPLAMLVGINVSRWYGNKLYITLAIIGIGAWIYISFFLLNSLTHNWWQPAKFVPLG
jgi:hypothetical protein